MFWVREKQPQSWGSASKEEEVREGEGRGWSGEVGGGGRGWHMEGNAL